MRQDGEKELLGHIEKGITGMTPEFQEELWTRPVPGAEPGEWYLDPSAGRERTVRRNYLRAAVAACVVLCMLSGFLFQFMPSASVYLDVNPSVTLKVNYRNRVTSALACNGDAEVILSDMELRGADLDVALYAILGSMVHHGYLTEAKDTVLVSVHSANQNRAKELETEVTDMVNQSLEQMISGGEVLSQQIDGEDLDRAEDDRQASPGKAAFIEELVDRYPQLEKDDLEHMTMDDIVSMLEKQDLDYSDYLDEDEPDEDEDDFEDDDDPDDKDEDDDFDDFDDEDEDDDHKAGDPGRKEQEEQAESKEDKKEEKETPHASDHKKDEDEEEDGD